MPSSRARLNALCEALPPGDLTARPMMGEYLLYYRGKHIGGLYDDRLLLKPVGAARAILTDAPLRAPYPGAKPLLSVENTEDRARLLALCEALYAALPEKK